MLPINPYRTSFHIKNNLASAISIKLNSSQTKLINITEKQTQPFTINNPIAENNRKNSLQSETNVDPLTCLHATRRLKRSKWILYHLIPTKHNSFPSEKTEKKSWSLVHRKTALVTRNKSQLFLTWARKEPRPFQHAMAFTHPSYATKKTNQSSSPKTRQKDTVSNRNRSKDRSRSFPSYFVNLPQNTCRIDLKQVALFFSADSEFNEKKNSWKMPSLRKVNLGTREK